MPTVQTGFERLLDQERDRLQGRKIGLCCNPTTVDSHLVHAIERLHAIPGVQIVALFGPEHGIRGEAQDMISVEEVQTEPLTGAPIYSLYGHSETSLRPTPAMLDGIDLLLYDIQDIGSRYYTYIYTMSFLMEAAGKAGIEIWILDRPNPINGLTIEGPSIAPGFTSFVGQYPLATRHGMTSGELALMFRDLYGIRCNLQVIPMTGWSRSMWFDQTGLPWILPSPNMPTLDTATVYPGGCLFEGTNLSEGRGCTRPFEITGAPYLDPFRLVEILRGFELPGVFWRPLRFEPTFHKWAKQSCGGIQIHVTDRQTFRPLLAATAYLHACRQIAPTAFAWREQAYEFVADRLAIDLLYGSTQYREAIDAGAPLRDIEALWLPEQRLFAQIRKPFLLYS